MKPRISRHIPKPGYALLLVLVFLGLSLLLLTGALTWSAQNARDTDRSNEFYTSAAAAEAATEKVLVRVSRDYISGSESALQNNLGSYAGTVPTATDDAYWSGYAFTAPAGGESGVWVGRVANNSYVLLGGQYSGLSGNRSTYRIASTAQLNGSRYDIPASVWQDVGVESIPLFQFAIFYSMDLEIEPGANMIVTGRVHSNSNLWVMPNTGVSLVFSNDVTASGLINSTSLPFDPYHIPPNPNPNITYLGEHDGGVSTLNLPIGTNNTPDNVFQVLEMPPAGESPTSAMGENRFYNKADVMILVSDSGVTVTSGADLGPSVAIPTNDWMSFLSTGDMFYNGREDLTNETTQLDVGAFKVWAETSNDVATTTLRSRLIGRSTPAIVYIADTRPNTITTSSTNSKGVVTTSTTTVELGVRLVDGANLPNNGLTVATPNPVYIQGDYNTTTDYTNFSRDGNDTTYTRPAAVMGDAITLLSNSWKDSNSKTMAAASDTTVNAALLGGIVLTGTNGYSGGVENFPRFLENWSGHNLWYNGSMVVLFNSRTAVGPWVGTGGYYNPPKRIWAFDTNFYNPSKLPPGTPSILFIERLHWAVMNAKSDPSDTTTFSPANYDNWPSL